MVKAYGSITLVDISDLGTLSVTPESNFPDTIIYTPDSNTFFPECNSSKRIKLAPRILYGAVVKSFGDQGITINWYRKNNGEEGGIDSSYEEVKDGNLEIFKMPLSSQVPSVTYVCEVEYRDTSIMGPNNALKAKGEFTYSLVQNASKIKNISITGETVFLYDGSNALIGKDSITLTAHLSNVSIDHWEYGYYKTGEATLSFEPIPNSAGELSIVINETTHKDYFNDNVATIRAMATDSTTYDIHEIIKMKYGADGDVAVTGVLTNDSVMIPFVQSGAEMVGDYAAAYTEFRIYEGGTNITNLFSFTPTPSTGVIGSGEKIEAEGDCYYRYAISGLTANVGSVTLTAQAADGEYNDPVVKTFKVTKVASGRDGTSPTIYSVEPSTVSVQKSISGTITPSSVNIGLRQQTENTKSFYPGRIKIIGCKRNSSMTDVLYGPDNQNMDLTEDYPASTWRWSNYDYIVVEMYKSGGFSTLLDSQTITIISDGATGQAGAPGAAGQDAYYAYVEDTSMVLPCTNSGLLLSKNALTIPFACKKGSTQIRCKATSVKVEAENTSSGFMVDRTQYFTIEYAAATPSVSGRVMLIPNAVDALNNNAMVRGRISFTIQYTTDPESMTEGDKTYHNWGTVAVLWTKNLQALDGTSPVLFTITHPLGNVINNGENSVLLEANLIEGSAEKEASTYQWQFYSVEQKKYVNIADADEKTYTVNPTDVQTMGSYCCIATYNGKTYKAYVNVEDHDDDYQINIISTLGDKIINSKGVGMIYCQVFRKGNGGSSEIDPMKTVSCGTTLPSTNNTDGYFYYLNTSSKQAQLYEYASGNWVLVAKPEDLYSGKYEWSIRRDDPSAATEVVSARAMYLDHTIIDTKAIIDLMATFG